jgi:tyrosyl-tRNA synthetase
MARNVVTLYHDAAAAAGAEERFDAVHKRGEVPTDAPDYVVPDGDPLHLPALLVGAGLAPSSSAARREIDAGAVRIDGVAVSAKRYDVPRAELIGRVLASGKRRVAHLVSGS